VMRRTFFYLSMSLMARPVPQILMLLGKFSWRERGTRES
jgi:hypothetical protein